MSHFNDRLSRLFSHQGIAGRLEFFGVWMLGLATTVVSLLPYAVPALMFAIDLEADDALLAVPELWVSESITAFVCVWCWFTAVLGFAVSVMALMTACRRLAHIGISKWWVLLSSVPLVNIAFLLFLFFKSGKAAEKTDD